MNTPIPLKPFYMIRHGESTSNRDGIMSGSIDTPLTKTGKQQAEEAHIIFEKLVIKPAIIVHSNLSRAINTAKTINKTSNIPMYETPLLAEMDFGDWATQSIEIVRPKLYSGKNPPNGDTHEAFGERVKEGLNYALNLSEKPVMIVCHGGIFRAFHKFYNVTITPTENAKLYYFEPCHDTSDFPWKITLIE